MSLLKRSIWLLAALCLMTVSLPAAAETALPAPPEIRSEAAIVINADTGAVLYEKNSHGIYHPASCTKIMTAILTLENGSLDDSVTMSYDAIWGIDRMSNNIALDVGEVVSVKDLLHGLLIASGNECAIGLAEYISQKRGGPGTVADFAELMNERAKELGAQNTHFVNPNGLYDEAHVTTPYDLAQMMKYAVTLPEFVSVSHTSFYTVYTDRTGSSGHAFSHTNQFIRSSPYYNSEVLCGKSGFTKDSGSSLVTCAARGDTRLIVVTMGTPLVDDSYVDTKALMTHFFEQYATYTPTAEDAVQTSLVVAGTATPVYSKTPAALILPTGVTLGDLTTQMSVTPGLQLPLNKDTEVGTVTWYCGETLMAQEPLYTAVRMEPLPEPESAGRVALKLVLITVLVLIGAVALFLLAALINRSRKRRRRKKLHRQQNIFR